MITAIELYNALIKLAIKLPRMGANHLGLWIADETDGEALCDLHDTDAIYIMCGIMEDYLWAEAQNSDNLEELTIVDELNIEHRRKLNFHLRDRFCIDLTLEGGSEMFNRRTKHEALLACVKVAKQ